jgi:hypothetical protein
MFLAWSDYPSIESVLLVFSLYHVSSFVRATSFKKFTIILLVGLRNATSAYENKRLQSKKGIEFDHKGRSKIPQTFSNNTFGKKIGNNTSPKVRHICRGEVEL